MLVLTRRPGESVMLGDDVQVRVTGINGNQVKLGFSAPRAVRIQRTEVWLERQLELDPQKRRRPPIPREERRRRSA